MTWTKVRLFFQSLKTTIDILNSLGTKIERDTNFKKQNKKLTYKLIYL